MLGHDAFCKWKSQGEYRSGNVCAARQIHEQERKTLPDFYFPVMTIKMHIVEM